jgi:hypothetical protein
MHSHAGHAHNRSSGTDQTSSKLTWALLLTLSFAARANEIAGAIAANRQGFYNNLDHHTGQIDSVLREHFSGADGETPQDFRNFLNGVQESLSTVEGFTPYLSGSVRRLPGGCFYS